MTVAFEIPGLRRNDQVFSGYRPPLVTVWHVDPKTDGTDDSCDWYGGRLTGAEYKTVSAHAKQEHSFFFSYDCVALKGADVTSIIWAAYRSVKWILYKEKTLSHQEIVLIMDLATCPGDNLRHYASKSEEDAECFVHLFVLLARQAKKNRRPWYRHPRWHIHHWKLQIHPWQRLHRWLFVRCAHCGRRFDKSSPHLHNEKFYHGKCLRVLQNKDPND